MKYNYTLLYSDANYMSVITLTKWGNSAGIRIPSATLKAAKAYIGEKFELVANKNGGFSLNPLKDEQAGWREAFNAAVENEDNKLLLQSLTNKFDKDEWTW